MEMSQRSRPPIVQLEEDGSNMAQWLAQVHERACCFTISQNGPTGLSMLIIPLEAAAWKAGTIERKPNGDAVDRPEDGPPEARKLEGNELNQELAKMEMSILKTYQEGKHQLRSDILESIAPGIKQSIEDPHTRRITLALRPLMAAIVTKFANKSGRLLDSCMEAISTKRLPTEDLETFTTFSVHFAQNCSDLELAGQPLSEFQKVRAFCEATRHHHHVRLATTMWKAMPGTNTPATQTLIGLIEHIKTHLCGLTAAECGRTGAGKASAAKEHWEDRFHAVEKTLRALQAKAGDGVGAGGSIKRARRRGGGRNPLQSFSDAGAHNVHTQPRTLRTLGDTGCTDFFLRRSDAQNAGIPVTQEGGGLVVELPNGATMTAIAGADVRTPDHDINVTLISSPTTTFIILWDRYRRSPTHPTHAR